MGRNNNRPAAGVTPAAGSQNDGKQQSQQGTNLTQHTAGIVFASNNQAQPSTDDQTVEIEIKYPADWAKKKFFHEGDRKIVSASVADSFVEMGIATIITEE